MATRCPRCQKKEITLETFGVYRCPACGRIDADGKLLDIAAPPPEVPPEERVSFAPPPPKEWVPPSGATPRLTAPVVPSAGGPPTMLFAACGLVALGWIVAAVSSGSWGCAVMEIASLFPLISGRPWARVLSIVGSVTSVLACVFVLVVARGQLPPNAAPYLMLSCAADAFWLYVLFLPETVRYFQRRS
jgi:hypothetical protein